LLLHKKMGEFKLFILLISLAIIISVAGSLIVHQSTINTPPIDLYKTCACIYLTRDYSTCPWITQDNIQTLAGLCLT